jgi:hypothetical protein
LDSIGYGGKITEDVQTGKLPRSGFVLSQCITTKAINWIFGMMPWFNVVRVSNTLTQTLPYLI